MLCAIEKEGIGTCHGDSGMNSKEFPSISEGV